MRQHVTVARGAAFAGVELLACQPKSREAGRRQARSGFTLIELLVVISIIAILATLLMPMINGALKKADKGKAQHDISGLVAAIRQYYGDYGKWPCERNGLADSIYGGKGSSFEQNFVIGVLRGTNRVYNPRGTAYLDVPKESMSGRDSSGQSYTASEGYFLDPWGNPYMIAMDTDNNGEVRMQGLSSPPAPSSDIRYAGRTIAVVSYGPDITSTNSFISNQ